MSPDIRVRLTSGACVFQLEPELRPNGVEEPHRLTERGQCLFGGVRIVRLYEPLRLDTGLGEQNVCQFPSLVGLREPGRWRDRLDQNPEGLGAVPGLFRKVECRRLA